MVVFPTPRLVVFALILAALSGCESLTDAECVSADWYQIGVTDGAEGRGTDRIEAHRKACADVGVAPDAERWLAGRERGLRLYCTPAKAYEVGREGRSIRPGCTEVELQRMAPAYEEGRNYWRLELEIRDLKSDIREIDHDLASLPPDASAARARLFAERARLLSRLSLVELQQRRYAIWP